MLDKIKAENVHKEPAPHIIINHPIEVKNYDHLYEQWNNPAHVIWQELKQKHNVELTHHNKLEANAHRGKEEYVGYWFFKDRSDKRPIHIKFHTTNVKYRSNTLFICDSKFKFTVKKQDVDLPDMQTCYVYFNDQRIIKEFLDPSR